MLTMGKDIYLELGESEPMALISSGYETDLTYTAIQLIIYRNSEYPGI
jgi:hypothetical protein